MSNLHSGCCKGRLALMVVPPDPEDKDKSPPRSVIRSRIPVKPVPSRLSGAIPPPSSDSTIRQ